MAALSAIPAHSPFPDGYASRRSKPNRGRRLRYTDPHRWTPGFRLVSPDKALAMIIMHYLYAYGPVNAAAVRVVDRCSAELGSRAARAAQPETNQDQLQQADREIREILEGKPRLSVGTVTAGGHA
ncbi:MAG TPA: hypothetical protein VJ820_07275 [Propionibacteriaceae bacterium]|nr:hypothetical protein [Propionibacteriaceae bacterium]